MVEQPQGIKTTYLHEYLLLFQKSLLQEYIFFENFDPVKPLPFEMILIDNFCYNYPPNWLSQPRGGCEKVKQEPEVAVVVVNVIELSEQLLPVVPQPCVALLLGGLPQQLLVVLHELGQDPPSRAQQPADGEEGADQVNTEHHQCGEQDVEIKLCWNSGTLVVCLVNLANWILNDEETTSSNSLGTICY